MDAAVDGSAEARLMTASWWVNAGARAARSNSDTCTGVAPCRRRCSALVSLRANAETVCPARMSAGTAYPPSARYQLSRKPACHLASRRRRPPTTNHSGCHGELCTRIPKARQYAKIRASVCQRRWR
jgi:hypothetical protein